MMRTILAGAVCLSLLCSSAAAPAARRAADADDLSWIEASPPLSAWVEMDSAGRYTVELADREGYGVEELWSVPLAGGAPGLLSGSLAFGDRVESFRISPDGRWVAFTVSSGAGEWKLFRVAIAGGAPIRVDDDRLRMSAGESFAFRSDSRAVGYIAEPDRGGRVVEIDVLLVDGFESGDTSRWSDTTPNLCPTPTGGPTFHANAVAVNEVWTANGSPHVFTSHVQVPVGRTLTVEPCAELRIRPGLYLEVNGTLVARGTPLRRIAVRRDNAASPFASVWVRNPGTADLAFLDLEGGGSAPSNAALLVEGADLPNVFPAKLDHVKVLGSAGYGLWLTRLAGLAPGSRDLVISGAGATSSSSPFPIRLSVNAVPTVPTGIYTGNASDQIQVEGGLLTQDALFRDPGVPYQIGSLNQTAGVLTVSGNPGLATLTIDPGVEIRFFSQGSNIGGLFVNTIGNATATGRLIALGTAARPIRFTGAGGAPVAGSWEGVTFFGALATGNLLDHVEIDAAGDNGGDAGFGCPPPAYAETSAAVKIFSQPAAAFLTNSLISNSSTHGVFRAWIGGEVDFMAGNGFSNVAFCRQVLPKPAPPGGCPSDPPCP